VNRARVYRACAVVAALAVVVAGKQLYRDASAADLKGKRCAIAPGTSLVESLKRIAPDALRHEMVIRTFRHPFQHPTRTEHALAVPFISPSA